MEGLQKSNNFETILGRGKSVPLGGTFGDFCDFWVPIGVPKVSILKKNEGGVLFFDGFVV